jgi:hypothetical protein
VGKTLFFDSQIDFGHVDRSATPAPMFNSIIRSSFLTTSHSFARHSGKPTRLTLARQQPTCLSSGFQASVKEVGVGNRDFAERDLRNVRLLYYSALILAALMIGPHSSLSVRMRAANSSGVELLTSTPSGSNFDPITGSASTVAASACIFLKISGGVFAGASSPYQPDTSKPGTPDSAKKQSKNSASASAEQLRRQMPQ